MKNFTIPKPCHENWEDMSPEEKGKFCGVCQKKVYDFTETSSLEIEKIYHQENGNICGRLKPDQTINYNRLQKFVVRMNLYTNQHFSRFGLLVSAVTLLFVLTGCEKKIVVQQQTLASAVGSDTTKPKMEPLGQGFPLGKLAPVKTDSSLINPQSKPKKKSRVQKPTKKVVSIPPPFVTGEIVMVDSTNMHKN